MIIINLSVGSRYPVDRKKIRLFVKNVLANQKVEKAQLDISIVGERKMKQLNEAQLDAKGITDVLSFPQEEDDLEQFPMPPGYPKHLGDVVVCFPEAVRQASKYGKLVDDQICFLIEHGIMHLLGFHHD